MAAAARARARVLVHGSPHSLACRLPSSRRRSLNWIGLARHDASSQNYTRMYRYSPSYAPPYPKTIDWRIVLPVYRTSNAMEIQFNWLWEHRTCNGAVPFALALVILFDSLRTHRIYIFDIHTDTCYKISFFHVFLCQYTISLDHARLCYVVVDGASCFGRFYDWMWELE